MRSPVLTRLPHVKLPLYTYRRVCAWLRSWDWERRHCAESYFSILRAIVLVVCIGSCKRLAPATNWSSNCFPHSKEKLAQHTTNSLLFNVPAEQRCRMGYVRLVIFLWVSFLHSLEASKSAQRYPRMQIHILISSTHCARVWKNQISWS